MDAYRFESERIQRLLLIDLRTLTSGSMFGDRTCSTWPNNYRGHCYLSATKQIQCFSLSLHHRYPSCTILVSSTHWDEHRDEYECLVEVIIEIASKLMIFAYLFCFSCISLLLLSVSFFNLFFSVYFKLNISHIFNCCVFQIKEEIQH